MDAAKQAVNKIIGRGGHHDTDVTETVNPAVTQETVKPHRHEETTTAIDKEVHQDHYHTTVQPLQDRQVLPEQHRHQELPVQEREFRHGDDSGVKRAVDTDAAQFRDSSRVVDTTHSASSAGAIAGEHVHHHVHENVQPVIHKETVQPEVVHTTQPIYEKHQAPSEHHGMSVLPTKTLGEVTSAGQNLTGTTQHTEHYEGDPRPYDPSMQVKQHDVDKNFGSHDGLHGGTRDVTSGGGSRAAGSTGMSGQHQTVGNTTTSDHRQGNTGLTDTSASGVGNTGLSGQHQTARNTTTSDHRHGNTGLTDTSSSGIGNTGSYSTTQQTSSTGTKAHDLTHRSGHGITNQTHHGTERDNIDRNLSDDIQHGSQPRDPAVIDTGSDGKKLTGSGADGSHSAVFGLTPDGHKDTDTHHGSGSLQPAHSKGGVSNTDTRGSQHKLAEQMNDPRVSQGAHGYDLSSTGSAKPGAGAPGGEQGFGQIRPEQHGATSKMQNKIDPTTDADGDGKRGVMD